MNTIKIKKNEKKRIICPRALYIITAATLLRKLSEINQPL